MKKLMLRGMVVLVLSTLLAACSLVGPLPSQQLVKQAIAMELQQTQQALRQQLRMGEQPVEIKIDRVKITEQTPLTIEDLQGFRVQGRYDFTVKLPQRQLARQDNAFEVYLQRQAENKTWRLAHRQTDEAGEPVWATQAIQ